MHIRDCLCSVRHTFHSATSCICDLPRVAGQVSNNSAVLRHSGSPPVLSNYTSKLISGIHPFSICYSGSQFVHRFRTFLQMENFELDGAVDSKKVQDLLQKVEDFGVYCNSCVPGQYTNLICPKCNGGQSMGRSLSFHISKNVDFAMWRCFYVDCGWSGRVFSNYMTEHGGMNHHANINFSNLMPKYHRRLEPLGDKLIKYFAGRMISKETLQKNGVMQISGAKNIIAFTYRRDGVIVNCKYRSIRKKYWQETGSENIFYGLDDIKVADEIIIVEGEIDKLSMEEAGFHNCVSVPNGAPQKVSTEQLPSFEKDTRFHYLWNCKQYLDKASRIIIATDSDIPGQALAEELARRLGKERCWLVCWPKRDEINCFKDANEVLNVLGRGALKDIINNAKLF